MMHRRSFLILATGSLAMTAMAACSQQAAPSGDREATLKIWNPQDNWRKTTNFYDSRVQAFKDKYPKVKVEYVDVPYGQYEARYTSGFSSSSDAPDIFMGQVSYYGGALGIAAIAPDDLQKTWEEKLSNVTRGNFKVDGQWAGYPVSTDLGMQLYYNTEHFTAAGLDPESPPQTFQDLRQTAGKLAQKDGDKVVRNGLALRYSGNPTGIADKALPYVHAFGGRLYAQDHKTSEGFINGEGTIAGIQYMQDLVTKDRVSSLELGSPDDTFAQGLSSMTLREGWYEGWLKQNAPGVKFAVVPYPEGPDGYPKVSLLFNWAWMVSDRSSNKDLAWEWMRTVASPATDLELAKVEGYLPVWTENFTTPYVTQRSDFKAVEKQMAEGPGPVYNAPYTNQIALVVGTAIEKCLQGADVKQTLDGIVPQVDELLERGR